MHLVIFALQRRDACPQAGREAFTARWAAEFLETDPARDWLVTTRHGSMVDSAYAAVFRTAAL